MPPLNFKNPQGQTLTVNSPDGSMPSEQELDQMFAQKYSPSVANQGPSFIANHPFMSTFNPLAKTLTGSSLQDMGLNNGGIPIPQDTSKPFDKSVQIAGNPFNRATDIATRASAGMTGNLVDQATTPSNYALGPAIDKGIGLFGKIPVGQSSVGELASKVQLANPFTQGGRQFMGSQVDDLAGNSVDNAIKDAVTDGISRGLRPSVSGKQTPAQQQKFNDGSINAVTDFVKNKDNLNIVDDKNNPVDPLQGGVRGFFQGMQQRMDGLVKQWTSLAQQTGEKGVTINTQPMIDKLNGLLDEQGVDDSGNAILGKSGQILKTENPADYAQIKAVRDGLKLRGDMTPEDALDKVQNWNRDLAGNYQSGFKYGDTKAINVIRGLTEDLRGSVDDAITNATGEEFQPLRSLWGNYKSLVKDTANRVMVLNRASPKSIWNLLDAGGNAELMHGLGLSFSGNPMSGIPMMLKGGVLKLGKSAIEKANNPDNIINGMLGKVDSLLSKGQATTPSIQSAGQLTTGMFSAGNKASQEVKDQASKSINDEWLKHLTKGYNKN